MKPFSFRQSRPCEPAAGDARQGQRLLRQHHHHRPLPEARGGAGREVRERVQGLGRRRRRHHRQRGRGQQGALQGSHVNQRIRRRARRQRHER